MDNSNDYCPTKLLVDAPSDKDEFGPHLKVAKAISDLVLSERGGQAVGISGKWGSGKSTVLSLLKDEFGKSEKHEVWVFDAWAHEGDPLRRAFLESLISFLSKKKWIDNIRWTKRIKELSGRLKRSTQQTTPRLSRIGMLLGVSALLIPVGAPFLSNGLREGITLWDGGNVNWSFIIGLNMVISPLIVIIIQLLVTFSKYAFDKLLGKPVEKPDLKELFAFFANKTEVITQTETIETVDPTSIEFEKFFIDILVEALTDSDRRLILAIDNLERIDGDGALKILSTLQTFLLHGLESQKPTLAQLWVVVTYDHDSLSKLWEGGHEGNGELAASFLDKSFPIRFNVPPPLVSDWKEYLLKALRTALPKHKDEEFHRICRLVAVRNSSISANLTPRNIKLFVNHVGALHRQFGDSIPIEHMAYYALLHRDSTNIVQAILEKTIPSDREKTLVGDGVYDNLAAITFGVEPRRARQVLLEGQVSAALAESDGGRLQELAKISEGFPEVLENTVGKVSIDWPAAEGANILNAATAIKISGLEKNIEPYQYNHILSDLASSALAIKPPVLVSDNTDSGFLILVNWRNDSSLAKHLFGVYADTIKNREIEDGSKEVESLVLRLLAIAKKLEKAGFSEILKISVKLPGGISTFVSISSKIKESLSLLDERYLKIFSTEDSSEEIAQHFQTTAAQGTFSVEHIDAIALLKIQRKDIQWEPVFDSVYSRLNANNNIQTPELGVLLDLLMEYGREEAVGNHLNTFVTEGHAAHYFGTSINAQDIQSAAKCLYVYAEKVPALTQQGQINQSPQGFQILQQQLANPTEDIVSELSKMLVRYGNLNMLTEVLDAAPPARQFMGKTLSTVTLALGNSDFLSPKRVIDSWHFIVEYLPREEFFHTYRDISELAKLIISGELEASLTGLYVGILDSGKMKKTFQSWCVQKLQEFDQDFWFNEISDYGETLQFCLNIAQLGVQVDLGRSFRDALYLHAKKVSSGELDVSELMEDIPLVTNLLETDERVVFRDQLYRHTKESVETKDPQYFSAYGGEITASHLKNDPQLLIDMLDPLLSSRHEAGLSWLLKMLKVDSKLLLDSKLKPEHLRSFRRALSEAINEDHGHKVDEHLNAIALVLKVRPSAKKAKQEHE